MKKLVLMTIAVLLVAAPLMAGNYLEDFESYNSPGTLPSGFGPESGTWSPGANFNVVADSTMNGTQVLKANTTSDLLTPRFSGVTFEDGTVASVDIRMDTDSDWFFWNLSNANEPRGYAPYPTTPYAGILFDRNNSSGVGVGLFYGSNGYGWTKLAGATMNAGDNYRLSATLKFTSPAIAYSITNLTDDSLSLSFITGFGLPTTTASAAAGNFYIGAASGVSWDNLAVTTVPEPGSMLALGSALVGFAGMAIRRRK